MAVESGLILLLPIILLMAILYSSVGHGGASGYIAAMALFGLEADVMRPVALLMNIVVTLWLLTRLSEYRLWALKRFWPLILVSAPAAFIGGTLAIGNNLYLIVIAFILLLSGLRMLLQDARPITERPVSPVWLLVIGLVLGLLSGITGVGGGIFLSPILIIFCWADMRQSTAVAALFILANSVFGLGGYLISQPNIDLQYTGLIPMAFVGALLGAELAKRWTTSRMLQKLLGIVLAIAATKIMHLGLST